MSTNKKSASKTTLRIAMCGVFAALTCLGTLIQIPIAVGPGYVNLGDAVILVCAMALGPVAAIPAALGAALADLISGYAVYILPTFIIKGLMGLASGILYNRLFTLADKNEKANKLLSSLAHIGIAFLCEAIMILGYFCFESLPFMYGVSAALLSVPFNAIQALAAIIISTILFNIPFFRKKTGLSD